MSFSVAIPSAVLQTCRWVWTEEWKRVWVLELITPPQVISSPHPRQSLVTLQLFNKLDKSSSPLQNLWIISERRMSRCNFRCSEHVTFPFHVYILPASNNIYLERWMRVVVRDWAPWRVYKSWSLPSDIRLASSKTVPPSKILIVIRTLSNIETGMKLCLLPMCQESGE